MVDELCGEIAAALDSPPASVILHGSLALGDYRPGLSDVDLLVVIEAPLGETEAEALTVLVSGLPYDADLRVVTSASAAAPTRAPAMELYVGQHFGDCLEVERCKDEPDLVAEFSMCRAFGRPLMGPGPRDVIGPVPDHWVIDYGGQLLAGWQELTGDADHAELMVLTACRIWRFAKERRYSAKADAGRWALDNDPSLRAIPPALRQREGVDAAIAPADIAALLTKVGTRLATLRRP